MTTAHSHPPLLATPDAIAVAAHTPVHEQPIVEAKGLWTVFGKGTEAFAVFAYDPDAPTGSGWWHWQVVNIPKEVTSLASGAGDAGKGMAPAGSLSTRNDYGATGFGGACPPKGHGVHRYQFTVFALPKKLDLPKDASPALTGYMVRASALASSTIEALYKRD